MASGKITKLQIGALARPAFGKNFLWDDKVSGFGAYCTSSGSVSYVLQYRMGGRGSPTRRYTIGRHGSPWSPETARHRAIELLFEIHKGVDPLERERVERQAQQQDVRLRFENYFPTFMELHVEKAKLRSGKAIKRTIERDLLPYFAERTLDSITRQDILRHLELLGTRSPTAASKAFDQLRIMLNFARGRDDIKTNPMDGMARPHVFAARDRVLWDWELQRVWEAAHDMGGQHGLAIHLLMLTGQRLNEVAGMSWSEIELSHSRWVIPKERAKNNRQHLVPLPPAAVEILEANWPSQTRQGLLFPNSRGTGHTRVDGIKTWLDFLIARRIRISIEAKFREAGETLAPFTFHDLRRSMATGLQRLGVPLEHTEALLNHVSGSRSQLINTYQTYRYDEEKGHALELWANYLSGLMARSDAWPGGKELPKLKNPFNSRRKKDLRKAD